MFLVFFTLPIPFVLFLTKYKNNKYTNIFLYTILNAFMLNKDLALAGQNYFYLHLEMHNHIDYLKIKLFDFEKSIVKLNINC